MKSQVKTWHVYIYVYPNNNSKYSCCSSIWGGTSFDRVNISGNWFCPVKIRNNLLVLAAGTTDTKFCSSTGVTTANSTNKYQNAKSVELGDKPWMISRNLVTLVDGPHQKYISVGSIMIFFKSDGCSSEICFELPY